MATKRPSGRLLWLRRKASSLGCMRGGRALAVLAVCLGSLTDGAAGGGVSRRAPCHAVSVVQDAQSHSLRCVIKKAQPPMNAAAAFVCLEVPAGLVVESAVVNTARGRSEVLVSSAIPPSGPYMLTIDATKVACAASGSLSLVLSRDFIRVDGFARQTVPCAELPLFRPEACSWL